MEFLSQYHQIAGITLTRVVLGLLFIFQGYDAVFTIGISKVTVKSFLMHTLTTASGRMFSRAHNLIFLIGNHEKDPCPCRLFGDLR